MSVLPVNFCPLCGSKAEVLAGDGYRYSRCPQGHDIGFYVGSRVPAGSDKENLTPDVETVGAHTFTSESLESAQTRHRSSIIEAFVDGFSAKYDKGVIEHGGKLWEHPDLLGAAIEEVQDLVAYLYTMKLGRDRLDRGADAPKGFAEAISDAVDEAQRITENKVPLEQHSDGKRLGILVEEVGEVATECLQQNVVDGPGKLYAELAQVAAFAVCWMAAINRENK